MAIYPIKMLKDEEGQPFVPLTHINAIQGAEYATSILEAERLSAGHYKITNKDIDAQFLQNKVIAVRFIEIGETATTTYMKVNDEIEYPIYKPDGSSPLLISDVGTSVCYFTLTNNKWQMVLVGTVNPSDSGHTITDNDGKTMTQRAVLNFSGFDVRDDSLKGATKVSNPAYVLAEQTGESLTISPNTWTRLGNRIVKAPEEGLYRVNVYLEMNNITSVGREIGVRAVDINQSGQEDWYYQYKRCKHTFSVFVYANGGNTILTPWVYIDPLTSSSTNTISNYSYRIEKLNVK